MNRFSLTSGASTIALALLVACASEPPAAPEAPAPTTPAEPAGPSPLAAANTLLGQPLTEQDRPNALLDQADALIAWGEGQSKDTEASAKLAAAQLQLIAVATARGKADLGVDSGTLLRRIATKSGHADEATPESEATTRVKEAALAILGLDGSVKDVRINRGAALELATSDTIEGHAVRVTWLARAARSLDAWASLPAELRASVAVPLSGRMLCPRCADAHHITPDKVVPLLLGEGNTGGLICDMAITAGASAKTASEQLGALSLCDEIWPSANPADPGMLWGTNALVIGLLRTAHTLTESPAPTGPLGALISARIEAVKEHLTRPIVLPTALVTSSSRAEDADGPLVFIPGLGGAGLTTHHAPLGVVSVGPEGVRMGLRPTVAVEKGQIVSLSLQHGLPAGGRLVLSLEDLRNAQVQSGGAIDVVTSAVNEIEIAAKAIAQGLDRKGVVANGVTIALDANSAGSDVTRVLDALRAAGVEVVHLLKSASHGHTLPLMVRDEVAGTRTVLETAPAIAHERPMIAVVTRAHVDVWAPRGPAEKQADPASPGKPPEGAALAYKGQRLVRIRIPIADPAAGIQSGGLSAVAQATSYFRRRDGGGPLLHVIAGKEARAADVVLVSRTFQERAGTPLKTPQVFWQGTSCGAEAYKAHRRTTSDCATGVAVAFSALPTPSGRGLSSNPAGASRSTRPEAPAAPPAGPPVSEDFCSKSDIRVAMNRNKGSFRFCYQRELQNNADLSGKVVLRFTIGTDGRPKGASIASSTLNNKTAHGCILKTLRRMTFKPPKGGVCPVRWPFSFQPK